MQLASAACELYGPAFVLPHLIKLVGSSPMDWMQGVWLSVSLFLVQVLSSVLRVHGTFINEVIGIQFTACLRAMLFQKALNLSAVSKKHKSAGDIANIFTVDVVDVMGLPVHVNMMWICPLQIGMTLYFIHRQVGWAIWVGFGALIGILALTGLAGVCVAMADARVLAAKDNRMKLVHELFGAIQSVKFNAWEDEMSAKIIALRNKEVAEIWSFIKALLALVTSMSIAPVIVTVVVFATYAMWMDRELTVSVVFTTLALFKTLEESFAVLPVSVVGAISAFVSAGRIDHVLRLPECELSNVTTHDDDKAKATFGPDNIVVSITDGSFVWGDVGDATTPLFQHLDWTVKHGELVVVHGAVGAGKSSLCSVLLGEMTKLSGSVFVGGSIAYVAQQPWILNASIRDNILFGKPYDRAKYSKVLDACALTTDIQALPSADHTEIGLKGGNLSGGQRARVSLARACYADADVYILDAPLAAVDALVSNEIFTRCFRGLLRLKTVILVSHSPDIITSAHVDRAFLLQDGRLLEAKSTHQDRDNMSPYPSPLPAKRGFWEAPSSRQLSNDEASDSIESYPHDDLFLVTPTNRSPIRFYNSAKVFTPKTKPSSANTSGTLIVDESRADGRVSSAVVLAYLSSLGGYGAFAIVVWTTLVTETVRLACDLWLSYWGNQASSITAHHRHDVNYDYLTVYTILVLAMCVLTIAQVGIVMMFGLRGSKKMFEAMLASLVRAPMRFFDTNPIGRILNRCGDDVFQCDIEIPLAMSSILTESASAFSKILTSVFVIQWMGLLLPPLMFGYYKLGAYFLAPLRDVNRIKKITLSPLLSLVSEAVDGAVTIRAFGDRYRRRFCRMHDAAIDTYSATCFATVAVNQWYSLRIQCVSNAVVLAILLGCVVCHSNMSAGLLALVITYGLNLPVNLANLVNMWASLETSLIAPERLHEYANLEKEGSTKEIALDAVPWPTQGHIVFDRVSFQYKMHDPLVLQNVCATITGGEKVGVVGRTGAGKSSLTMALFRINELAFGQIKIDEVDTATLPLRQLRRSLAIIPQNPVLFKGSLRTNLDPLDMYSDEQLWAALHKVNLMPRITATSDAKLEQSVDENGDNFSVGERQMLCMARALLRQARIVVLDEATAAVDQTTDEMLQKIIRAEFASSTLITIAHRLGTVLDYDRILVLENGTLVQNDSPTALLADATGAFYELAVEGGYVGASQINTRH
ncbi:hypothetical protein DYB32_007837 [Aphanomyces invadans]|uniref:Uncharacterized protein n=1 Tax=Aphanomyces invadans TaxID=157072 RepID=A0A3R7A543_9STRA|nr:hypothetical protein DYB32_007837 [Aphanomyces invadans]